MTTENQDGKFNTASQKIRDELIDFLPTAFKSILEAYSLFSENEFDPSTKGFKNHQESCKSAISNIERLTKLAQWADLPQNNSQDKQSEIGALLALARAEIDNFNAQEND